MDNILFVDSAARKDSRTRVLCRHLLERLDGNVTHLTLNDAEIPSLTEELIDFRAECSARGDFSDAIFDYARQFKDADTIVICAPFWDGSFPAVLKKYIESLCVTGLTFYYTDEGVPRGLCKAKRLFYVTTAGGPIYDDFFGYGYIKSLAGNMFGIEKTYFVKAENLDIDTSDADAIMRCAFRAVDEMTIL